MSVFAFDVVKTISTFGAVKIFKKKWESHWSRTRHCQQFGQLIDKNQNRFASNLRNLVTGIGK